MPMTREEFAFSIKQKYPQYRDLDNNQLVDRIVGKYPQYKSEIVDFEGAPGAVKFTETREKPGFNAGKAAADFLAGLGGRAAETFTNIGSLGPRLKRALGAEIDTTDPTHGIGTIVSEFMGDSEQGAREQAPFEAAREEIQEQTPKSTAAKLGGLAESVGEFALGGAARTGAEKLALSPLAQKALQEAITSGVVGGVREGELFDPASAGFGAAGAAAGSAVSAAGKGLTKHARRVLGSIIGEGAPQHREAATAAIADLLERRAVPKGANLEELAAHAGTEAKAANEALEAFRSAPGTPQMADIDTVLAELNKLRKMSPRRGVELDPAVNKRLDEIIETVQSMREPGNRVLVEELEALRRIADAKGKQGATSVPTSSVDREAGEALRQSLNTAQPGREEAARTFHQRQELAERLAEEASKEPLRLGGQAGLTLALAGGGATAGGVAGGREGAATGLLVGLSPFLALRLIRSPVWKTMSAPAQHALGQALQKMSESEATKAVNAIVQAGQSEIRR